MNNPNNPTRTITALITEKSEKTDRNGNTYYILQLNNGESIFAFAQNNHIQPWIELEENQEYQLEVKEGNRDSNILVSFKKVERH